MPEQPVIPLGTWTRYGEVGAVVYQGGERYYLIQKGNVTSLIPADALSHA